MNDLLAQAKGWTDRLQEKLGRSRFEDLLSTTGILIVLLIILLVNLIFRVLPIRFDLTEHQIYTLSPGTKEILRSLDTPVKVKFYVTDSADMMSADQRQFARSVEDRLIEYRKVGGQNLIFEKLNPEPDTNAEDSAELDGLGPVRGPQGEFYMGIVVECIDKKEVIPYVDPEREQLLEYDVTNAITRVYQDEKPKVKLMTGINVAGGFSGNFQAPPADPWVFYRQLSRDYEVEVIPSSSDKISPDTSLLVVLHPYDVTEVGEYAIDQYLLSGGTVLALVDPMFYSARMLTPPSNPMMGGMPPQGPAPSSDLPTLFGAWGVEYQASQVVADTNFQTQIGGSRYLPTYVSLTQDAFNRKSVVTAELSDVGMPFPGGFEVKEPVGVDVEALITTSKNNKLVASFEAEPESLEQMMADFRPTGKPLYLAARLTGRFKTAFPDGNPKPVPDEILPSGDPTGGVEPPAPEASPETGAPGAAKPEGEEMPKPKGGTPAPAPGPAPENKPENGDREAKPDAAKPDGEGLPKPDGDTPGAAPEDKADKDKEAKTDQPAPEAGPAPEESAAGSPPAERKESGGEAAEEKLSPEEPAADAEEAAPASGGSLKETVKGKTSTVVIVSDVDFLYDAFAVEIINFGPVRQAIPRNQNLSLAQNLVEHLVGDQRLISVRSRASTRRPFTLLNQMQAKADNRMMDRFKELEAKEQEVGRKLQEALKIQEDGAIVLDQSAIDQGTIEALRQEQISARRDIRELRKELRREKEGVVNMIKFLNIALMPLLVIIVGLTLYGKRQNRMAAR